MNDLMNLNSLHLNYLTPLLKWRVMDLETLRQECINAPKYKNFQRAIRKLEQQKILEGFKDPHNRKKYVYLSSIGEKYLSLKENPTAISKDTLLHDIIVSKISRDLFESKWVSEIFLEHQLNDKKNFRTIYKIIPDAMLVFEKNNFKYRVALELELTRKSNQRIVEKLKQYDSSEYYHYVFYLFTSEKLLTKYKEIIQENIGESILKKVFFFLVSKDSLVKDIKGHYLDQSIEMKKVFESYS